MRRRPKTAGFRSEVIAYQPEVTGYSPIVFEAMDIPGENAVLVLTGVTGGGRNREIPADWINLSFVLGSKVVVGTVNASGEYFENRVKDPGECEFGWPGWLSRLLTRQIAGLENWSDVGRLLTNGTAGAIKVFVKVGSHGGTQP